MSILCYNNKRMTFTTFGYVQIRSLTPEDKRTPLEEFLKSLQGEGVSIATIIAIRQDTVDRVRGLKLATTGNDFDNLLAFDTPRGTFVRCEKNLEKNVTRPSVTTLEDLEYVALVRTDGKEFPRMIAP